MRRRSTKSEPRRTPSQARGEQRVRAILDAAAELLAQTGYEGLTLSAVAERSRSATGSVYHFFSSKDELIDALVERLIAGIRELFPSVLTPALAAQASMEHFAHQLLTPIAQFVARHPEALALMWRVSHRAGSLDDEIASRLDAIVSQRAPHLQDVERMRVVRMTMEIVRAGIRLLSGAPKASRAAIQAEAELALSSYLRARLWKS